MPTDARVIGMGLVGAGFVGVHHVDAVRRLGFVDLVGVAASSEASARAAARTLRLPHSYANYEALIAERDIHVVHIATPNHLHVPIALAAIAAGKHVISDKPLAATAAEARRLLDAARLAGVVHAVTFNYRGSALVQEARAMIAVGDVGPVHYVHGAYLQDWLLKPTDFSWRLDPEQGGPSSAVADIGSHWCDLVEHVSGRRITALLADLATVVPERQREGRRYAVRSEDLATVLLRFEGGARGTVSIGQVCAGHKNDCWFEVNGATGSLRWRQELQSELWIGRRDGGNSTVSRDPASLSPVARPYAHLPPGHQEGWSDAFFNVIRDVYTVIRDDGRPGEPTPPAFASFEDGVRAAILVDAVLESHRRGGVWVDVGAAEPMGSPR